MFDYSLCQSWIQNFLLPVYQLLSDVEFVVLVVLAARTKRAGLRWRRTVSCASWAKLVGPGPGTRRMFVPAAGSENRRSRLSASCDIFLFHRLCSPRALWLDLCWTGAVDLALLACISVVRPVFSPKTAPCDVHPPVLLRTRSHTTHTRPLTKSSTFRRGPRSRR